MSDTGADEQRWGMDTVILPLRTAIPAQVSFNRQELNQILNLYGQMVAAGEWRDYAMDFLSDRAVFSVFRRSSEMPLYRILKTPALARKQGAYSVLASAGQVLKRGHELELVLRVLQAQLKQTPFKIVT